MWTRVPTLVALGALSLLAVSTARADYPIASHRYLADPGALVSGGRVYLYNSNDDDNPEAGGYEMKSIVCLSSSDLKNWTDHGEVFRVPTDASWAGYSWAPYVVERTGRFFMYFGNNANGIGVASSTTAAGRFRDAKGSALVASSTPGAAGTNSWLFDPATLVDDDGQAYLYFGGNGESNARIIRLGSDLISVSGSAIAFSPPAFFEASSIHKRNGIYYFSYSTNSSAGLRIDYMTSNSPTSGFTYRGVLADQPPSNSNNNHATEFEYAGNWYHVYHNRYVAMQSGVMPGYRRSLALERLNFNADGTIVQVTYTMDGVPQIGTLNPYVRVEAETFHAQSGIETEVCGEGGMNLTQIASGDWVRVRGVDFGNAGARTFAARVASAGAGGSIELRLASATGTLVGTCTVPATGGAQSWMTVTCDVTGATGVKDLVLRFAGTTPFNVNYWQFTGGDGGAGGAGGGGSAGIAGASGSGGSSGGAGSGGRGGSAGVGGTTGGGGRGGSTGGASGSGGIAGAGGGAGRAGIGGGGGSPTGGAGAGGVAGAGGTAAPGGASGTGTGSGGTGGGPAGAAGTGGASTGAAGVSGGGTGGAPASDGGTPNPTGADGGCSCAAGGHGNGHFLFVPGFGIVLLWRRRLRFP